MKLDPVYVLEPKADAAARSRRAFLGMGIAFVCGGVVGTACGYTVGKAVGKNEAAQDAGGVVEDLEPTGDADLDELRRLAIKAPIDELMGRAQVFLMMMSRTYRRDEYLWQGFDRIASSLTDGSAAVENRRLLALFAAQVAEQGDAEFASAHQHWVPVLRSVR